MDNFDINNPGNQDLDKPIPIDDLEKPIPFDEDENAPSQPSQPPLNLDSGDTVVAGQVKTPETKAAKHSEKIVSSGKITGVKTFFTKLHIGSIAFLDEQISNWLKANPDITIKRTNTATGNLVGKKTEPNIIITIWY